jgi:putative ABC transport system permease protein
MLRSYLKVAVRNILRHKFYAVLNISGLALGLTASLLIGRGLVTQQTGQLSSK